MPCFFLTILLQLGLVVGAHATSLMANQEGDVKGPMKKLADTLGKQLVASVHKPIDDPADKFVSIFIANFDRSVGATSLHHLDLDSTTLGKRRRPCAIRPCTDFASYCPRAFAYIHFDPPAMLENGEVWPEDLGDDFFPSCPGQGQQEISAHKVRVDQENESAFVSRGFLQNLKEVKSHIYQEKEAELQPKNRTSEVEQNPQEVKPASPVEHP
eukprot:gnl/MRDRNA2_/MRDRNA2_109003_c0_seq1.p1 gnl/MRDRNA2_/MRDRNA2_109003_c0~~gnl/MRDRNA2_/MRDRNA2_109003_c0_seq1.p1  ORF type:complete len:213 (+),score=27.41 gnl/MRDRNA2_/MRDRNA2_109003_c0_seq1:66-704(+)